MTGRIHKSIFFAAVLIFSIASHVPNFSQSYEIIKPAFAEPEKIRADPPSKFGTGNADEKKELRSDKAKEEKRDTKEFKNYKKNKQNAKSKNEQDAEKSKTEQNTTKLSQEVKSGQDKPKDDKPSTEKPRSDDSNHVSVPPAESSYNESPLQTTVTEISSENKQEASTSHSVESEDKIDVSETLDEIRQLLKELEEIIQSILG